MKRYETTTSRKHTTLARRINEADAKANHKYGEALEHARRCGELLQMAKDGLPHGEWLPWLATNCSNISEETAQARMRIAARWGELVAKSVNVADLGVSQALKMLAKPKAQQVEEPSDCLPRLLAEPKPTIEAGVEVLTAHLRGERRIADSKTQEIVDLPADLTVGITPDDAAPFASFVLDSESCLNAIVDADSLASIVPSDDNPGFFEVEVVNVRTWVAHGTRRPVPPEYVAETLDALEVPRGTLWRRIAWDDFSPKWVGFAREQAEVRAAA